MEGIGLKDVFSIYAAGDQIDINSATLPVLRIILGVPKEIADQIIEAREGKKFQNKLDLLQRVPTLSPFMEEAVKLIAYQSSVTYYTIESRGKGKEGRSVQGMKVIVKIDPKEKAGYKTIQWVDAIY